MSFILRNPHIKSSIVFVAYTLAATGAAYIAIEGSEVIPAIYSALTSSMSIYISLSISLFGSSIALQFSFAAFIISPIY